MEFARVLQEIARALKGYRFGLAGAMALYAYGISRATADLDLVVEDAARGPLLALLDSLGYERLYVSEGFSNHLHREPAFGRVDFIYVDAHTADLLFSRAKPVRIFGDVEVLLPRPEHLAAMKAQAIRNDPSRTLQDLADVQKLLALPGVDREEVRGYFAKQGLEKKFDEIARA